MDLNKIIAKKIITKLIIGYLSQLDGDVTINKRQLVLIRNFLANQITVDINAIRKQERFNCFAIAKASKDNFIQGVLPFWGEDLEFSANLGPYIEIENKLKGFMMSL